MTKECERKFTFFSSFDFQIVNLPSHPSKFILKYLEAHLSNSSQSIPKADLKPEIVIQSITLIRNIK